MKDQAPNQPTDSDQKYEVVGPKRHRGKGFLKFLLILLLLALVGGGVWYWQQQKIDDLNQQLKDQKEAADAKSKQAGEKSTAAERVQVVRPPDNSYSVEAPVDWLSGNCEQLVFLAPTEDLLGKCATEFFGMVSMNKTPGDNRSSEDDFSDEALYSEVSFEAVTVGGVPGVKVSYTQAGDFEVGPPAGTYSVSYQLFDGTNTYVIGYSEYPGWPNHRDEFEDIAQSFAITLGP